MAEQYFTAATFKFQRDLAKNNNRAWFNANKQRYENVLRDPFLRLIEDMQAPLAKISTHYRADPRPSGGSLFRIYRDTRFRNDKTPYKTWAGARFGHERRREIEAPSFYLHIQQRDSFAGGGLWHPEPPTLKKIREFLSDNPAAWKKAVHGKAFRERFEFWGEALTRPPKGFPADHPAIDLIRCKQWGLSTTLPVGAAQRKDFARVVEKHFRLLAPMVDALNTPIAAAAAPKRKVLFGLH